ncbi:MAG: ThiF family adenylyltransferase [Candidatus Parvarchaeota archaeon]|nr:ThiF family adenylyltransferase [Candidatus Parvarchaeota archaeon]
MDLNRFNIVVIGAGALGGAVLSKLIQAGPASIKIVDGDVVTAKNSVNQPLFTKKDADGFVNKADAIVSKFSSTSSVRLVSEPFYVGEERIDSVIEGVDIVIDTTDNNETRLVINDACVRKRIPLAIASVRGNNGLLYIVDGNNACFNCIYRNGKKVDSSGCASVTAQRAQTVGVKAVDAVVNFLMYRTECPFTNVNADTGSTLETYIKKDSNCETCQKHIHLDRAGGGFIQICGEGIKFSLQKKIDLKRIAVAFPSAVYMQDGRLLRMDSGSRSVLISDEGDFLFSGYDIEGAKTFISSVLS